MKTTNNDRLVKMTNWQFAMGCVLVFAVVSLPIFVMNCLGQLAMIGTVNAAAGMALAVFFAGPVALLHFAIGFASRKAMTQKAAGTQA